MQKVESRAQSKFGSGLPRADPSTFIKAQNQVSSDEEFHSSDSAEDSGPVVKPFKAKGQRGKEGASAEPKPHPRSLKAAIRQGLQGLGIAAKDDHHPPAKAKDDHEPPAAARKPDRKRGGGVDSGGKDARSRAEDVDGGGGRGGGGGGKKAPVWSGAEAGSYKIIDKTSLKTHRENVRKGR
jgi:hypothetical protein